MTTKIINPEIGFINKEQNQLEIINKNLTLNIGYVNTAPFGEWIEKDQLIELLSKIPESHTRDLLFFNYLWRTGCRVSEALAIKKENINFKEDLIEILWLKSRKGKTRYIPLHQSLKNLLFFYTAKMNQPDRLFKFSRQRADILAKKYGFGHCHIFRHSFAVNFVKQNKGPRALEYLQKLLGHSVITITQQYLHVAPDELKNAMNEIKFD